MKALSVLSKVRHLSLGVVLGLGWTIAVVVIEALHNAQILFVNQYSLVHKWAAALVGVEHVEIE